MGIWEQPRIERLINDQWKFTYGDELEAAAAAFDDSQWYDVGIPHSFGTPYFMENEFYVGDGCYRKWLTIPSEWIGRKISLEFQAAFQEAEIYLNGQCVGRHQGGYTAFIVEIAHAVQEGENLLFVRLNNRWNPRLAPRAGEHVFNGGLYRDVSLIVTDPLHVEWYGTKVTTPQVSQQSAQVESETEVVNAYPHAVNCELVSRIEGADGYRLETREHRWIEPGEHHFFRHTQKVANPLLWYPDTPHLYVLTSLLYEDGVLKDQVQTTFGIRWFDFDAKEGFSLNGQPYELFGANVHQDRAGWGDAVTREGMRRDIRLIKECGMNIIRGSHYPHHPFFAEECDRQGMLFWSELCFWGVGGANIEGYWTASAYPIHEEDQEEFEESCMTTLREMIRTNRNHPSLIVWSVSNEPFFSDLAVMEQARGLAAKLTEECRRLDATRPAAVGGAQREGFDRIGDLAGYNGDGASLYRDPGFPSIVSEYGSAVASRPGEYSPHYTDGVEQNPQWRSGKILWCGFDHGSYLSDMGYMGMIDYYRLPLRTWYWYRHDRLGIEAPPEAKPGVPYALSLTADKLSFAIDGTDDTQLYVELHNEAGERISNTITVTLDVISGGGLLPTGRSLELSPKNGGFLDGAGAIEMRAYHAGPIEVEARAEGVRSARLTVYARGDRQWDEPHLKLQSGPPSVMPVPVHEQRQDIARSRPVFCSSYLPDHPAMHVTDGNPETFWRAESQTPEQWVMVDLEGTKRVHHAVIQVTDPAAAMDVSWSNDGKSFTSLSVIDTSATLELPEQIRYLRVLFPDRPTDILQLYIYA